MKRRDFPARRMRFTIDSRLLGGNYGQYSGCRFCWRTSMMTQRYPMGICWKWSPFSPHEIHGFRWLDAEKPCRTIRLFQSCASACCSPINVWKTGDNVEEQFPVKVSSNCPCWVHKLCYMAHGSWRHAQAVSFPLRADESTISHWLQTIIADILRPLRAQCGAVWGSSGHQGAAGVPKKNDLSLRGLRGLWRISVPNSGKRYGELLWTTSKGDAAMPVLRDCLCKTFGCRFVPVNELNNIHSESDEGSKELYIPFERALYSIRRNGMIPKSQVSNSLAIGTTIEIHIFHVSIREG